MISNVIELIGGVVFSLFNICITVNKEYSIPQSTMFYSDKA